MVDPYEEFKTTCYDYAIIGTGVTESVIAASLSHQKKRVVVIDPHFQYGVHSMYLSQRDITKDPVDVATDFKVQVPLKDEKYSRSISVDLTPQLFYSNGTLLSTIASSEVYKYLEFLSVDAVYMYNGSSIIRVC